MNPTPEEQAAEMQEQAAAEALGVQPEIIEVPPGVRVGITLFELEDGNAGFLPVTQNTTLMDALLLCTRILTGINADLIAQRVVQSQMQQAGALAKQAQKRPAIVIPGRRK